MFLLIALLFPNTSWGADGFTCEDILSPPLDASICNDIRSAVFIIRFAIRDVDAKVGITLYRSMLKKRLVLQHAIPATKVSRK